ncbi:trichohyalin isoform X3 [Oryzias melastigma]|uniref:trichohyalin isoform X3 n=1 Tax=Oryzias melastigma TaxID=30732 RepID=UPI000CF7FAE2|nr:trichohyalin isoform X3 [Oryzias melastigma]
MMNDDKETSSFSAQSLEAELQSLLSALSCRLEEDREDMERFLPHHSAELEEQLQELQERLKLQQLAHTQELQALKLQLHLEKLQLQERTELLSSEVTHQAARMKEQQEELKQQLKQQLPSVEQLLQLRSKQQSADQQLSLDQKQHEAEEMENTNRLLESRLSEMMEEKKKELREVKEESKLLLEQNKALFKEKEVLQLSLGNLCSDVDEVKANMKKDSLQILSLTKDVEKLRRKLQLLETKEEVRTLLSALQLEDAPRENVFSSMKHMHQTAPPAVEGAQQQRRTEAFERKRPQITETPPPKNMRVSFKPPSDQKMSLSVELLKNSHRPPRAQIYEQKLLEILQRQDHQSPSG